MKTMMRRWWIAGLFVAALSWTAPAAQVDEPVAEQETNGPQMTVIEVGEEPRRELRLTVSPGDTQRFVLVQQTSVEQSMDGHSMGSREMPATEMHALVKVNEVTDEGDIHYTVTYEEVDVQGENPQMVRMMRQSLEDLIGMEVEAVITSLGAVRSVSVDTDNVRNPMTKQMIDGMQSALEHMIMPLPEEPVGNGAKWKSQMTTDMQGIEMMIDTEVEVAAMHDDRCEMNITMDFSADEQDVEAPGMPPNARVRLTQFSGEGSGRHTHRIGELIALGEISSTMEMHLDMEMGAQKQSMQQTMNTTQTFKEPPEKSADGTEDQD